MSTMGGDGDRGEVQQLREEVAALNGLLEESASALFALNETLHTERERNEKLLEYFEEVDESYQSSRAETAQLKSLVSDLLKQNQELELKLQARNESTTTAHTNDDTLRRLAHQPATLREATSLLKRSDLELSQLRSDILNSTKNLAEELCDRMVEADEEIANLMSRFPSVDFERPTPEVDPYKSTKGWTGRRGQKNKDTSPESDANSSSLSLSKTTPDRSDGYLFGSPSERFPMSKYNDDHDDEHEHGEEEEVAEELHRHGDDGGETGKAAAADGAEYVCGEDDNQSIGLDEALLENLKIDLNAYNEWELSNSG